MSQAVAIVGIIQPAPGKLDRLREAIIEAIEWIKANEPETMEFSLYKEGTGEDSKLFMTERYASQAAMDKHGSSDNYKAFFKTLADEELLVGAPFISKGRYCHAFRRYPPSGYHLQTSRNF